MSKYQLSYQHVGRLDAREARWRRFQRDRRPLAETSVPRFRTVLLPVEWKGDLLAFESEKAGPREGSGLSDPAQTCIGRVDRDRTS